MSNKINYQCFQNGLIDGKEVLARKAARLLWGKGFKLSSEDEKINKFLQELQENAKLYNIFYANEKLLSKYGRSVITIDKTVGGKYFFTIAYQNMMNKVGRILVQETSAVVWKRISHSDRLYWVKEEWDTKKVVRTIYDEDQKTQIAVLGFNSSVPLDMQVQKVWKHNLGILPLIEFHNLPDYNFDFLYMGYNPDDRACANLIQLLNHTLLQLAKELVLNRTRVFGKVKPSQMQSIANKVADDINFIINDLFYETELIKGDGTMPIEILQGDPKLEAYWTSIKENIELYFNISGYEWDKGDTASAATATGSMLGKQRDVETTLEKKAQRQRDITRLIDRVLLAEKITTKKNYQTDRPYTFEINTNIVIDEFKKAETAALMLENGLASRRKLVAELHGLTDVEAAEYLSEIDKEALKDKELWGEDNNEGEENTPVNDTPADGGK